MNSDERHRSCVHPEASDARRGDDASFDVLYKLISELGGDQALLYGWEAALEKEEAGSSDRPPEAVTFYYAPWGKRFTSCEQVALYLGVVSEAEMAMAAVQGIALHQAQAIIAANAPQAEAEAEEAEEVMEVVEVKEVEMGEAEGHNR